MSAIDPGSAELALFVVLAAAVSFLMVAAHAMRGRLTLGPVFALAAIYVQFMWQLLESGWWSDLGGAHVNASLTIFAPALLAGLVLTYCLDGLRVAKAYLLVVLASSLFAGAFHEVSRLLPRFTQLVFLDWRQQVSIPIAFVLATPAVVLGAEMGKRLIPQMAMPGALIAAVLLWMGIFQLFAFGSAAGFHALALQAGQHSIAAVFPLLFVLPYGIAQCRRNTLMPPQPLLEVMPWWRSVDGGAKFKSEAFTAAQEVAAELRQLNHSVAEAERRQRYQEEVSDQPIFHTDQQWRVTRINPAARRLLDAMGQGDAGGQSLPTLLTERGGATPDLSAMMRGERSTAWEQHIEGQPNRQFECLITETHNAFRHRTGFSLILRDVTAERQLARRHSMERRVKDIHRTGRVIAHDFSNVLTGIDGQLQRLKAALKHDQHEAVSAAEQIALGLKRSRELLSQVGATHLIDTPSLAPVAVSALLQEAAALMQGAAAAQQVSLELTLPAEDATVEADHGQMLRVLTNLINNAIRASGVGGHVWVSGGIDGRLAFLRVEDSGPGMTQDQLGRAFDPAFSTKGEGKGGLGLAISFLIVDAHGGELAITNGATGGLLATIRLPLGAATTVSPPLLQDCRIIVFGPDEDSTAAWAGWLEKSHGAKACETVSGGEIESLLEDEEAYWQVIAAVAGVSREDSGMENRLPWIDLPAVNDPQQLADGGAEVAGRIRVATSAA